MKLTCHKCKDKTEHSAFGNNNFNKRYICNVCGEELWEAQNGR